MSDLMSTFITKENQYLETGKKCCSSLKVMLQNEGILGGPHKFEMKYSLKGNNIDIKIEQAGNRKIVLTSLIPAPMNLLWDFYGQLERLLMLFDGRFLNIKEVVFSGEECVDAEYSNYADECKMHRLSYCKTDPAYCNSNHCFLEFDNTLTPELLTKWILLQEQLDIVNQTVLYNIADTGVTHDIKCANLIECLEPVTEIINEYEKFFPNLKPGDRTTTLKMRIDAVISKYGQDIFFQEYMANKERFLQVLVNTRNRIMHIKRNQPQDKYLSGPESILYLVKLCHLYRIVLLSLLGINYDSYKSIVIKSVEQWNSWEETLDKFVYGLTNK